MKSYSESYKAAGVDVTAGYRSVELIKNHVARTNIPGVLSGIGGFGGLFQPDLSGMKTPVFVSGTDGGKDKPNIFYSHSYRSFRYPLNFCQFIVGDKTQNSKQR